MKKTKSIRKPQSFGSKCFDAINYTLLALLGFIMLYPMYYVLIVSISSGQFISRGEIVFLPKGIHFDAYKQVFQNPKIWTGLKNSLLYTVVGTIVNVVMSAMCAYPLSRKNLYGRSFFMKFIMVTMFFGGGLIPMYILISNLNLLNSMWALILPGAISTYNMIVIRTNFEAIPESLVESAYISGANDLEVLGWIVLPLSKPILATMVLFYAVGHWNSYFSAVIYLNEQSKYPMQVFLRDLVIAGDVAREMDNMSGDVLNLVAMNYKYAVIIVTILPILVVYPFIQKYFTKGVMIGAVKG